MTTALGANNMVTMPPPRERGMTASQFRDHLAAAGVSFSQAANTLGVSMRTITRWARDGEKGGVPLLMAQLVRIKIRHKKK
jgi:transposase